MRKITNINQVKPGDYIYIEWTYNYKPYIIKDMSFKSFVVGRVSADVDKWGTVHVMYRSRNSGVDSNNKVIMLTSSVFEKPESLSRYIFRFTKVCLLSKSEALAYLI